MTRLALRGLCITKAKTIATFTPLSIFSQKDNMDDFKMVLAAGLPVAIVLLWMAPMYGFGVLAVLGACHSWMSTPIPLPTDWTLVSDDLPNGLPHTNQCPLETVSGGIPSPIY